MDALLVGALEALQDEVAVPVGLVAEPRLLAWRDRAVAHDVGRVGRVRGGALAAVGAPAPGVRAALNLAALCLDRVQLNRALRELRVGWAVELRLLRVPLAARSFRRLVHTMNAHHLEEDAALSVALLVARVWGHVQGMWGKWGVAAWPAVRWERLREGFPGQLVAFD